MTSEIALAAALGITGLMLVTWLVSLVIHDVSIVDIVWGLGFVVVGWIALWKGGGDSRSWLVAGLTTVWGIRLSGYLAWRNLGIGEDYRYQAMRRKYGARFPIVSLVIVFGLQGLLMWIISLPVQAASGGDIALIGWLGMGLWVVGVFFETTGDLQLAAFKHDPANTGKVLNTGLWQYTRHPNYFGDFCVWWGLYLIAASGGAWWTAIGPIVMTALLMRYSGAGLLEKTIGERRPGYAEYMRQTNAFFPGPPKT